MLTSSQKGSSNDRLCERSLSREHSTDASDHGPLCDMTFQMMSWGGGGGVLEKNLKKYL